MKGVDLQGDRNMTDRKQKAPSPLDNSHHDSFGSGDKDLIRPLLLRALEDIQPQLEAIQDMVHKLRVHKVVRSSRLELENLMCHAIAQEFCNEIEAMYPIPQNATVCVHINLHIAEAALQTSHLQDAIHMDDNGMLHIRKDSAPAPKRQKVDSDSDSDCCVVGTEEARPIIFKPITQASMKYLTSRFRLPCSSQLPYVNEGATAKGPPSSVTDDIKGDGLCFFHCVSMIISGTQTCVEDMKNACDLYIKNNHKSIPFMPTNAANKCLTGDEFLLQRSLMGNESKWATEMHIYTMAQVLQKDIIVHVDPPYGVSYEIFVFKPTEGSVSGRLKDALFLKHKSLHCECILGV